MDRRAEPAVSDMSVKYIHHSTKSSFESHHGSMANTMRRTLAQQTWVQGPLAFIQDIGGSQNCSCVPTSPIHTCQHAKSSKSLQPNASLWYIYILRAEFPLFCRNFHDFSTINYWLHPRLVSALSTHLLCKTALCYI